MSPQNIATASSVQTCAEDGVAADIKFVDVDIKQQMHICNDGTIRREK